MDNIYYQFKCPAKTNNERNLRDYHTKVVLDEYYMSVLNSKNEHDYRKKLQESADKIIDGNFKYLIENAQCRCSGKPCAIQK